VNVTYSGWSAREAQALAGDHRDYDGLVSLVGDARIVLIGEDKHGRWPDAGSPTSAS
jgi:hypothetical protein